MKKLILSVIILVSVFTSCNNDDQTTAIGDVYIVAQKSGQNTVYGLSLHAYAFSAFKSVTASLVTDAGTNYTLQAYPGYKNDFFYKTPTNQFSNIKPTAGLYRFMAIMDDGETIQMDDQLTSDVIAPAVITKSEYNQSESKANIQWDVVTNADLYNVELYLNNTLVFFTSGFDANLYHSISISASGSGWVDGYVPVSGTTYKVVVGAFMYENEANDYDIQASSISEGTILWNE